ncbi:murein transglycosylase domain-containing protein [Thiomicrospira microaerophila]|uniref:murein transglycosylase domain-containing protein n=1 Tax=Thiomicrospira microaerophila TaxID=406020 RepID=UPI00069912C2|nr:murein transglycosylase domain-containing protein [Thiomicrospira microaerophila]
MKFEHFIIALLLPAGMLLLAGGVAFQHFQNWALSDVQASVPVHPTALSLSSSDDVPEGRVDEHKILARDNPVVAQQDVEVEPASRVEEPPRFSVFNSPFLLNARTHNASIPQPGVDAPEAIIPAAIPPPLTAQFRLQSDSLYFWFPAHLASEQHIKRGVARILLSGQPFNEKDILSLAPMEMRERPVFYRRVLDANGQPIRYPFAAFKYVDYLLANARYSRILDEGTEIVIPLVPSNIAAPAQYYEPMIMQFAQDFRVSPALVFAVMETESHFNPTAVSRSNALGLMQIKPEAAGRDVYKLIDFRLDAPSRDELFDPQTNIRIGTAYLALLKYDYFGLIRNEEVREMIAISSYNGGLSTVWRLFGESPAQAVEQINRMNPRLVYRKLRYDHPSDETRRYLDKVLQAKARYQALLGEDARILASR